MKTKSTFIISLLAMTGFFTGMANGQTFYEGFENVAPPALPTGWTQWNGDGNTVHPDLANLNFGTNAWISYSVPGGGKTVISTSYYSPAGTANDWLITPAITVNTNDNLVWTAAAATGSGFSDGYEVLISTTDASVSSFTKSLFSIPAENTDMTKRFVSLSAYAGQSVYIAFRNNSNNKFVLILDDVAVGSLPTNDAQLENITPVAGSANCYGIVGTGLPMTVNLRNNGTAALTSCNIKYTDGLNVVRVPFSGSIDFDQYQTITLPAYSISSLNPTRITAWVEYSGDTKHSNDTVTTVLNGVKFMPRHRVTIEEGTGTWCGWCPRGAVFLDSIQKIKGDSVVLIAVHNNDPMTVQTYDAGLGQKISGFPTIVVERKNNADPSEIFNQFEKVKKAFGFAELSIPSLSVSGSNVTVNAKAKFAVDGSGSNWRMALVITEDDVHGSTTSYDQHNYYSSTSNNMPLSGAGHNWQLEPNPIPASRMTYNHVARYISGGFTGTAGSLPQTLKADSTYSYTFTTTLASGIRPWMCHANVLLINQVTGEVDNAVSARFTPLSVKDHSADLNLQVWPNPSKDIFYLHSGTTKITQLNVTDATGKTVSEFTWAQNPVDVSVDLGACKPGLYFIHAIAGDRSQTIRVVKQ